MKINFELINKKDSKDNKEIICKIGLFNKLDNDNANQFEKFFEILVKGGINRLLFDLNELRYIDSTGIGRLIKITKNIRKLKGDVAITRCSAHILEIFKLVRLEKFIKIFNSNEEGLNFLNFT